MGFSERNYFEGLLPEGIQLEAMLRRYKLDRRAYPEDLSALVPAYLPQLPIDPVTGKPPVYTRDSDGFTLTTSPSETYVQKKGPTATWKVAR